MAKETKFIDGMGVKRPHKNAPDFIKANISVNLERFIPFAKENANKGWLNIDLKKSKDGNLYLALDEWKKGDKGERDVVDEALGEEIKSEDIPF
jgi:hypothetical protein